MSETIGPVANNIGTGNIDGAGVGVRGEPGGKKSLLRKRPLVRKTSKLSVENHLTGARSYLRYPNASRTI